jgi:hypothetical protein
MSQKQHSMLQCGTPMVVDVLGREVATLLRLCRSWCCGNGEEKEDHTHAKKIAAFHFFIPYY